MSRKPPFFWWAIALGAALVLCYAVAGVEFWRHGRESKDYGWYRQLRNGSWYVFSVEKGGPADGFLHVGDRIVDFDGYHGRDWVINRIVYLAPAGGVLPLTVERGGKRVDVAVPIRSTRTPLDWGIPLMVGASLVCFAVAMLMGIMKPADRTVQFGCFTFLALAALLLMKSLIFVYPMLDGWGRLMFGLLALADPLPLGTGYFFAAQFPRRQAANRRWLIAAIAILAAVVFEWFVLLPIHVLGALGPRAAIAWAEVLDPLLAMSVKIATGVWGAERVVICAAIAAVLIRNYHCLSQPDLRRRIRWVVVGILVGLAPMTVLYVCVVAFLLTGHGVRTTDAGFVRAEYVSVAFLGVVAAITIAYGVLRHRVLDIHLVIRTSIQHLLAKRVLQTAISLPLVLLAGRALLNPQMTVRGLLFGSYFYLVAAAAAAAGLAFRHTLLTAVDRHFFREAYNQEQILRTLIEEIKDRDSISEISRLVSEKLDAALHPQRILVFYRREARGDFALEHSSTGLDPQLRLGATCPILRLLEESARPLDFPPSGSQQAPPGENEYLEGLGVRLLTPITGAERRLVGVLMLGEKRSESPYTGTDRDLLQAVAGQIGVVCDNIALRESARREAQIKRNVLAHLDGAAINLLKECPRCGTCFDRVVERCPEDDSELSLTLPVDRTIDGVYRVERRIGTGAMGAVYRATDLRLGRTVAVKVMVGSLFGDRGALKRFEREARAAARLSHPNIVAIHDFGAIGTSGAYLVMEMIEGSTLRAELRARTLLEPGVTASRFDQLMEGLSSAHANGVVHRDLKPENLIVARLTGGAELLKILDFGLAKLLPEPGSDDSASLTLEGAVVGTMGYMSPEQLLGEDVDHRTDTFAVGVLAIECLTGRRPFAGLSFQELLHRTLAGHARIPGDDPGVTRLNAVLARCLARDRDARPGIAEVRAELVDAIRRCPPLAAARAAVAEETTIDATQHFD
jgi:hypothetical protein